MTQDSDQIAKEGWPIILLSLGVALALFLLNPWAGVTGLVWVIFCLYFFRNPKRITPQDPDLIIAPADGQIIFVGESYEAEYFRSKKPRVTIFMSPFNVHVNRAPATGRVLKSVHHSGKFLAAFDPKASDLNERVSVFLEMQNGARLVFVQIAGWFARRIVCYLKDGDTVERGHIFGLIRFGSRMDVYLDESYEILVSDRQKVKAGQTVLAKRRAGRV